MDFNSTTKGHQCAFLALPVELFEQILGDCNRKTLAALARTNHTLYHACRIRLWRSLTFTWKAFEVHCADELTFSPDFKSNDDIITYLYGSCSSSQCRRCQDMPNPSIAPSLQLPTNPWQAQVVQEVAFDGWRGHSQTRTFNWYTPADVSIVPADVKVWLDAFPNLQRIALRGPSSLKFAAAIREACNPVQEITVQINPVHPPFPVAYNFKQSCGKSPRLISYRILRNPWRGTIPDLTYGLRNLEIHSFSTACLDGIATLIRNLPLRRLVLGAAGVGDSNELILSDDYFGRATLREMIWHIIKQDGDAGRLPSTLEELALRQERRDYSVDSAHVAYAIEPCHHLRSLRVHNGPPGIIKSILQQVDDRRAGRCVAKPRCNTPLEFVP